MTEKHISYDKEQIRARISMPDLVGDDLGELRRQSGDYVAPCPFHLENTASFYIYKDHAHCYGCGWHGDIFKWRMDRLGLTFAESKENLARLCGVSPDQTGYSPGSNRVQWSKKYTVTDGEGPKRGSLEGRVKPPHPPFRRLRAEEIKQLAALRGLDPLAVRVAANDFKRVGACDWPQYQSTADGQWHAGKGCAPAWVVTDDVRWCVQYRRLDGADYTTSSGSMKAWTGSKSAPSWPLGAADMGDRYRVMLVEGGADMLAAYHFLRGFGLLEKIAVVAILGSSNRIAAQALPYFAGKRVRIMIDADRAKPTSKAASQEPLAEPFGPDGLPVIPPGWMVPSMEGARKWQAQLTAAGAAVETFSLYGLKTATGERVGDLNDLALANADTLAREDVGEAFFCWDF